MNLNSKEFGIQQGNWRSIFMVAYWHIWTWRNKSIFEEGFQRPNDSSRVILKMVAEID
jgi:hypothetical protein